LHGMQINDLKTFGTFIYAATTGGVFYSKNNGLDWIDVSLGLPDSIPVTAVGFDGTYLYAGVKGNGVWKRLATEITHEAIVYNMDCSLKLYPNPATSYITLQSEQVLNGNISIFNNLGLVVKEEEIKQVNEKTIDIRTLPAGLYLLRYKEQTLRFMVVK